MHEVEVDQVKPDLVPKPQTRAEKEKKRLSKLGLFGRRGAKQGFEVIAGIDEAGRGPLAGPVIAAACCVPKNWRLTGVNDSKKLSAEKRAQLYEKITNDPRLHWAIGRVDSARIDEINILRATFEAMHQAIAQLEPQPDLILADGLGFKHDLIPVWSIAQGDGKAMAIAVASIIAKVTRDRIMLDYDTHYPQYGFARHKGYGTECHREALAQHGPSPIHRRSFLREENITSTGPSTGGPGDA